MAKRVNNSVIHSLAERMFVEEGLTAKAIAEATDMSEQTIGRWRKDGGWEDKRKQFLQAPQNIKKAITEELQRLAQGYDPRLDMKAINDVLIIGCHLRTRNKLSNFWSGTNCICYSKHSKKVKV